jgi:hypothetical protein
MTKEFSHEKGENNRGNSVSSRQKTETITRHIIRFPGRVKKPDVSRETSGLKREPGMFHVKHWGKGC